MDEEIAGELEKLDLNSDIVQEQADIFIRRYNGSDWEKFASGAIDEKQQEGRDFYLGALFIKDSITTLCSLTIQQISKIIDKALFKPRILTELKWSRIQFGLTHELLDCYIAYKCLRPDVGCIPKTKVSNQEVNAMSDYFEMKYKDKELDAALSMVIEDIEKRKQRSKDFFRGALLMVMAYQTLLDLNTKFLFLISQAEIEDQLKGSMISTIIEETRTKIYILEAYLGYKITHSTK